VLSRLETVDPHLQDRIISLDARRQFNLAVQVAELAANKTGVATLPDIAAILREARDSEFQAESVRNLERLVGHLDEVAWDFQDEGDEASYERAFGQARAANAVLGLAQSSGQERVLDVCYEAYSATGDMADVSNFVDEALRS
jgi:hypothetical protein